MRVLIVLILGLLAIFAVDGSVIPDEALTASLQDVWYEDEFIIAISNIRDKKKQSGGSIETILAVKYSGTKTKMVLLLDRRSKRVILESLDESGRRSAGHVNVDSLAVNTPLKSLIILVHQAQPNSRVDVYVDCTYEGSIPLKKTFRDIAETEDSPSVEVFRERKCRMRVYQSSSITEALKKEQCPDNLVDMKQPSIFETDMQPDHTTKANTDSDENDQKKSTNRPDGIESGDESKGGSSTPDSGTKQPSNNKKPSDKKDHHGRPSDRDRNKKKDHSGRPENKDKSDKYDPYGSSDPFSQPGQSGETDDLDYPDGSPPLTSQSTTGQRPTKHKGHQFGPTKLPDKPGAGRSDETDGLDYPDLSHPSQFTSQSPYSTTGNHPTKRPKKPGLAKPDRQSGSKPGKDQYGNQPDRSSPYNSNNPYLTPDGSVEFGPPNNPKRPGRSPYPGLPGQDYSNETDMFDNNSSGKRVPRRGDIGIQSLDERVCQTDDQLVKTLNELINATRKLWRELELNRMETQHLRQLIENCSACRTPLVTTPPPSTCDYNSPCYPGVDCRNTPGGPQCGPCPRGYTGNGWDCSKINVITCIQRPCFQGVRCYDHANGYKCGECPSGYVGDGERCERRRNPCDTHPCHPEVKCHPTHTPPYFK